MRLTPEQQKIVEENHNLIYAYIHNKKLDLSEWYGPLAEVLCKAVIKHNPEIACLSTYFYVMANNMMKMEYRKSTSKKRSAMFSCSLDEYEREDKMDMSGEHYLELQEVLNGEHGDILKLVGEGYNQYEISNMVGLSQSYVSRIIRKKRRDYYANR